ncbi:hypothetical protein Taro_044453, partial [Colocasia esculenta]|nr:hypothetical protein [Colocasia esculenta]
MFHGEYDPNKVESWTHELERIFETMECAEEDQVRLTVYQLKGAAHERWRVQRQTHFQGQRLDHITWQRFSEVFHGEYFPDYARRERRDQFHALVRATSQFLSTTRVEVEGHQLPTRLYALQLCDFDVILGRTGCDQVCAERFIAILRQDLRAARVLVDPGASLCFASEEFYESLACHGPERQCDMMVDLSSGDYMCSFGYLEVVAVEVEGHQLPTRLYALQLYDFDVILGRTGNAPKPSTAENATIVEVVIWSRRPGRSRRDRNALRCHDLVARARTAATGSRQDETSQQWQGVRRAEETWRPYGSPDLWAATAKIGSSAWAE